MPAEQAKKPGNKLRTDWLRPSKSKTHGEVRSQPFASWQIRSLNSMEKAPISSQLLARRRQSSMLRGQIPMPDLTMNTDDAWTQQREDDLEFALDDDKLDVEERVYNEKINAQRRLAEQLSRPPLTSSSAQRRLAEQLSRPPRTSSIQDTL